MEPFFSIVIPGHKADAALGGNSRASWQTKYRKLRADKNHTALLIQNELNKMGLTGLDFLTNCGQYHIEECLPVYVTFRRFYSGKAKQWDEDNLYSAYKGCQDAVRNVLGIDDKHFKTALEQIHDDFTELEIEITPAWARLAVGKDGAA